MIGPQYATSAMADRYRKVAVRTREDQLQSGKKTSSGVQDMGQEERPGAVEGEARGESAGEDTEEAGEDKEEWEQGKAKATQHRKGKGRPGSSVP